MLKLNVSQQIQVFLCVAFLFMLHLCPFPRLILLFLTIVMHGLQRQIHSMEHTVKDMSYEIHPLLLRFYDFLIVTATAQRQNSYHENYYSCFSFL